MTAAEQITLTADEIDTFAEVLGHEPTLAQVEWLEELLGDHRVEAVAVAGMSEPRPGRHGS